MKLYRAYCYIYYQAYLWQKKYGYGSSEQAATFELATAALFYIVSFFSLTYIIFGWKLSMSVIDNKFYGTLCITIPIIIIHHLLFLRKEKYKKILSYYEKHPPNKKYGSILHWSYFIGSFVTFVLFLFLSDLPGKYHFTVIGYLQSHFLTDLNH